MNELEFEQFHLFIWRSCQNYVENLGPLRTHSSILRIVLFKVPDEPSDLPRLLQHTLQESLQLNLRLQRRFREK